MSKIYLKVKIKSLAEEAKIIRKEEQKAIQSARWIRKKANDPDAVFPYEKLQQGLYLHRLSPVGTESRAALIAYGYINGYPYSRIEKPKALKALKFHKQRKSLSATELARYTANKWNLPSEYIDNITKRAYTLINKYGGKQVSFEEFEAWTAT